MPSWFGGLAFRCNFFLQNNRYNAADLKSI
jgi:hypothetical protein